MSLLESLARLRPVLYLEKYVVGDKKEYLLQIEIKKVFYKISNILKVNYEIIQRDMENKLFLLRRIF